MTKVDRGAERSPVASIRSGIPGLDAVLGEGLPESSFNLIAGGPGTGKTTLAQQIAFSSATKARPAIYFTVLGEPTLKMLRYQRQFDFFDAAKVGSVVQFVNLSDEALDEGPAGVLDRIVAEVERVEPGLVMVDSFRSIARGQDVWSASSLPVDLLVQRLALHLTTWEVTSFLIGEYAEPELFNPVFTVADGILWLSQVPDRNSVVRKIQAVKMRGRAPMPGLHTFRITPAGVEIFPRIPEQQRARRHQRSGRHATGIAGLDELMGGGIPIGDAAMITGPTGTGKTTFAAHFAAEAGRAGEAVVVAVFEEYPEEYLARLRSRPGIGSMHEEGRLKVIYLRPLDLSVDETLNEILKAVEQIDATRVVIDSLSGFEVALAPAFREDFRESLYRLVGALTATGVTVLMTSEAILNYPALNFSNDRISFITDDVVSLRYVELDGRLQKILVVVKMRGSRHSSEFRTYELGPDGAVIGGPLTDYRGIVSGIPAYAPMQPGVPDAMLADSERRVLDALQELGSSTRKALSARAGIPVGELEPLLDRLVTLGYAEPTTGAATRFRIVAR